MNDIEVIAETMDRRRTDLVQEAMGATANLNMARYKMGIADGYKRAIEEMQAIAKEKPND